MTVSSIVSELFGVHSESKLATEFRARLERDWGREPWIPDAEERDAMTPETIVRQVVVNVHA